MRRWAWLLVAACGTAVADKRPEEASGVVRIGAELWVVGDDSPGEVFVRAIGADGPPFRLDKDHCRAVAWPRADLALDLESVEVLADGRVVVLSERLAALVGEDGVVAEYGPEWSPLGGCGLEGLAVRAAKDGASRVAVLFEGGLPNPDKLPPGVSVPRGLLPRVIVHELDRGDHGVDHPTTFPLALPAWAEGRPLRAPDLVWAEVGGREGFVVLLQDVDRQQDPTLRTTWLQRYDGSGRPVGAGLPVADHVPADLAHANWEGMDWYEEGRAVVLVHDEPPKGAASAVVVTLPEGF